MEVDLRVRVLGVPITAVGWDEDSYLETPAVDAIPIHVPWDDDRAGGVFWLDAGDALQSADVAK